MRAIKKATPRGDQNNQFHDTTEERVLSTLSNMPQDRRMLAMAIGIEDRKLRKVDGKTVKPNVFYMLVGGKFTEVR